MSFIKNSQVMIRDVHWGGGGGGGTLPKKILEK
jgi:hypothetical protein